VSLEPEVAGPQTESAVTPRPAPASAPPVLDAAQRALLRAILNCIIPARADVPGAGDLDVGASIEHSLSSSMHLRRLFLDGLLHVAVTARGAFLDMEPGAQTSVLETVEARWPAFFTALVEHTYRGYYTLADVKRAIGYDPRPPQPLGYQLEPFDPALLERQRQRAPFWRQTH
jgi:hypothetical protein